jgi:predicted phosphodiesterase
VTETTLTPESVTSESVTPLIDTTPIASLGVIGDVHAEDDRLNLAIEHLTALAPDAIVCTGDIVDGGGCPNEVVRLLDSANIHTVRGNHDRWVLQDKARHVPDAHVLEDLSSYSRSYLGSLPVQLSLPTIHGKLLLCHGVADNDLKKIWPGTERMEIERSQQLDEIIASGEYRYIINGHMHFRTLIHFESLTLINAGTLKGEHWPGFAIIDFEQHKITAFEFRENGVSHAKTQSLVDERHVTWRNTQAFSGDWDPVRLF